MNRTTQLRLPVIDPVVVERTRRAADLLRPHIGKYVARLDDEIVVAADSPVEVFDWLRVHGVVDAVVFWCHPILLQLPTSRRCGLSSRAFLARQSIFRVRRHIQDVAFLLSVIEDPIDFATALTDSDLQTLSEVAIRIPDFADRLGVYRT